MPATRTDDRALRVDHLADHPSTGAPAHSEALGARIPALDVLRGVAVCGILLVNIGPVTHFQYAVPHDPPTLSDASGWLQLLVQQRFFPVFSVLFGVGFSLLERSARRRGARAPVVLARRLLVLLPLGVVHQLVHPGEALSLYAAFGLVVLVPSVWLPRAVVALSGAGLLVATLVFAGGGWVLIPSLFLVGSALVRCGVVDQLGRSVRGPAVLSGIFVAVAVPAAIWQLQDLAASGLTTSSAVAGLALAGAWVCLVLVLLRTRLRKPLEVVFRPWGRMALTNYVSATPVMVLAGYVLDLPHSQSWALVLTVAGAILGGQWVFSVLWLRRYRQGPLEWLWRMATWGRVVPLRRGAPLRRRSASARLRTTVVDRPAVSEPSHRRRHVDGHHHLDDGDC